MPTYEYECEACGETVEVFQTMKEAPKKKCPSCGKLRLKRLIGGGSGFIFKGSGFYITDYRSDSYKAEAKAEADSVKSSGDDSKSKSSDSSSKSSDSSSESSDSKSKSSESSSGSSKSD